MMDTFNRYWRIAANKVQQLYRLAYLHFLTRFFETIVVIEYPKSGGTWLGQLVSGYTGVSFPRNRFFLPGKVLLHGHYPPGRWIANTRATLWLVRDGRDVMVSHYHHTLLWNDRNRKSPALILSTRRSVPFDDYENIRKNLPVFIRYMHEHQPSRLTHFTYAGNWTSYQESWLSATKRYGNRITRTSYEALSADTEAELKRILSESGLERNPDPNRVREIVERFSFERQTGRKRGVADEKSFLRKGVPGDWVNHFTREAGQVWESFSGTMMRKLGMESSVDWYTTLPEE